VTTGSNVSALPRLLDSLHHHLMVEGRGEVISLESGDAPNLKTVLRNIIRIAVTNIEGNENYQKVFTDRAVSTFLLTIVDHC
jgi:origin recognition complex subunit 3